ncbi:PQQ-dependent sugar dehydrogenase [Leptolyngbya cf. ectocarpi LEGE 11479]|uniref:PQQ-dependent sugar dehydrogenase n=1 Tax=Leptolyngbya cf. ectocarpi LEGE 11479 TaxID=1828722 RepID=A0A928X2F4_LEPEC|nr:PQQ-dependent sugar dehydrogenase [Leptolyngbya ectocarpi]MBE9067202.1 PQQ-dependent sugar dehydrogenase [Leptolyngbya cf. ectocarpi LEGE 11479]
MIRFNRLWVAVLLVTTACQPLLSSVSKQTGGGYQVRAIASQLDHPWSMAWLPDGGLLITERRGRLKHWQEGQMTLIDGIPPVFAQGQGGLMDVAVHPQFEANHLVYFTYAAGTPDANQTQVARARFDGGSLSNWEVIFTVSPSKPGTQHFGSRLLWLPDNTLLVAIGDGGNYPLELDGALIRQQAQKTDSHLGKVIRLNDDGSIPDDNPAVGQDRSALWTYGHRNIQGLAYDATHQTVWATEHGARGGDELNLLESGENYGWPLASHSREYHVDQLVSPNQSLPGMVDPQIVWTPSIAPSGLAVYHGSAFPEWQGDLFAGALVDREIRRIDINASGQLQEVDTIAIGQRVRDVRQGPDGKLYALTDEDNGQLLVIEPSD